MKIVELDKEIAVGTSPNLDDLEQLKTRGFRSIVDLRGPGEVGGLTLSDEREAVARSGMALLNIPVPARTFPGELLDLFRQEVPDLPKPIFVHCTRGVRAGLFSVVHLGLEVGASEDAIVARARGDGLFDEGDAYEDSIRAYVRLAREPYNNLAEVIW